MLTPPPSQPGVSAPNQQSMQLLNNPNSQLNANPNLQAIPQMQQAWRQGMGYPGGLRTSAMPQSAFPQAGMGTSMSALSQNPMLNNPQQQAMIAALQGQRPNG